MLKSLSLCVITLAFLSGCVSSRKPASIQPVDRMPANTIFEFEGASDEQTLKDMDRLTVAMASSSRSTFDRAKSDVGRRLQQILKRSAAAAALMNDFDRKLDSLFEANGNVKAGAQLDLQTDPIYLKLQRTRDLVETAELRAATIYAHLWKISIDPSRHGISSARTARAKSQAQMMLDFIHQEVSIYERDVRVIGLIRIKHHLEEIAAALNESGQSQDPRFIALSGILKRLESSENSIANLSYSDFIDSMKNFSDAEYDTQMRDFDKEREPNNNVLVKGFRNTTGSEFAINTWVLTFDDGPHQTQTRKIADILKQNGAGGDFFWLSKIVKNQPNLVKSIYDDGFGVASHSADHANLTKLSVDQVRAQVSGSRDVIAQTLKDSGVSNYKMKDFRCPYGACWAPKSQRVQQGIVDAGLRHVYWTVDTMDWQDKNTQSVLSRTLKQMKASRRGVILFHDIHAVAGNVLPYLFQDPYVKENKLKFLSL